MPLANGTGIDIKGGASGNTVGGITAPARNIISGNSLDGVVLSDSGTTGNLVEGNYIGTNAAGNGPLPNNGAAGLEIENGASDNTVGGTTAGTRNVISGNHGEGLAIDDTGGSTGNLIEGNYVGTDASGSVRLANFDGIQLSGTGNTVGGTTPGAGNVISGNNREGIGMSFAFNDVVEGNLIGVNAQDNALLSNGSFGILAAECSGDTIGGTTLPAANVIGGLGGDGIEIDDSGAPNGTNNNVVEGNFLGTDPTGTYNFGNAVGILLGSGSPTQGVANNTISGNVIDNETSVGVDIYGAGAKDNVVQGNFIGTDLTGTQAHGNGVGVEVAGMAHNNTVGGTSAAARNLISGNTNGVVIQDSGTSGNVVEGNYVGTDITGTKALGNGVGVEVVGGAHNNVIGGALAPLQVPSGVGNVIAFNKGAGVVIGSSITDSATVGNTIRGNSIFANGFGIDLGNDGVTPNHDHNPSPGPNNLQNFPVLSSAVSGTGSHAVVRGGLHSAPLTTYFIDFYASAKADRSGFGQGAVYLGTVQVTTNKYGNASFNNSVLPGLVVPGEVVSATATDPGGDTSEFSKDVIVR
jgi:titin